MGTEAPKPNAKGVLYRLGQRLFHRSPPEAEPVAAQELPVETQEPLEKSLPQAVRPVGQNPPPIPEGQRKAILAKMGGEPVDTFPDRDLVGGMLSDMFSSTAVWRESDLSLAEKERNKHKRVG